MLFSWVDAGQGLCGGLSMSNAGFIAGPQHSSNAVVRAPGAQPPGSSTKPCAPTTTPASTSAQTSSSASSASSPATAQVQQLRVRAGWLPQCAG